MRALRKLLRLQSLSVQSIASRSIFTFNNQAVSVNPRSKKICESSSRGGREVSVMSWFEEN